MAEKNPAGRLTPKVWLDQFAPRVDAIIEAFKRDATTAHIDINRDTILAAAITKGIELIEQDLHLVAPHVED